MSKDESIVTKVANVCGILFYNLTIIMGLTGLFGMCGFYIIYCQPQLWPLCTLYIAWMFMDRRTPKQGGRKVGVNFIGSLFPFRCMRDYYPISLVKTADLDPKRNYVFGYHPHGGFMPNGLIISFGTNLLGFQEKFPGITPHIGAHSLVAQAPFYREVAMGLRVVDVGSESVRYILSQMGPGNSIAIVPGGAAEMLDSYYRDYILTINRRKQFIKMALETGSSLVPVFGFGQNDGYQQPFFTNNVNFEWLKSYKKSKPTALEKWSKVVVSSALMSFGGNYIPGLPYKKPITVVVGSPIHVEKVTNPSDEQISQLHALYIKELKQLFENNRDKYGVPSETKLVIQ